MPLGYVRTLEQVLRQRHDFSPGMLTPLRNDDIVVVKKIDQCRKFWPLGRIIELYPAEDDVVRSVKVLYEGEECLVPNEHIIMLEVNDRHDVVSNEVTNEDEPVIVERTIDHTVNDSECVVVNIDNHQLIDNESETMGEESSHKQDEVNVDRVRGRPKRKMTLAQ